MLKEDLKIGDKVKIVRKSDDVWTYSMDKTIGTVGVVLTVDEDVVKVAVDDGRDYWYYQYESLEKVQEFKEGDRVLIARKVEVPDRSDPQWVPSMDSLVGKTGEVMSVHKGGFYCVRADGERDYWNYPESALEPVPQPCETEPFLAYTKMSLSQNGFRPFTEGEIEVLDKICSRLGRQLVKENVVKQMVRFERLGNFTTCVIIDHEGQMCVGCSRKNKLDKDNELVGRVIALKRAILESNANQGV